MNLIRRNHLFTFEAFLHVLVVGIAVTALAVALQKSDTHVPVLSPEPKVVVPATGIEGYTAVLAFCNEATIKKLPAPDATGITYQLTRVKGGVSETIVVVLAPTGQTTFAKHYYDTSAGQQSEPAVVDEDAKDCIRKRAQ